MAERHSSENGRHGGPGLPMFCGVLGAAGLGLAAMTILMATQMSAGHPRGITSGGLERVVSQTTSPSSGSGITTGSAYAVQAAR